MYALILERFDAHKLFLEGIITIKIICPNVFTKLYRLHLTIDEESDIVLGTVNVSVKHSLVANLMNYAKSTRQPVL